MGWKPCQLLTTLHWSSCSEEDQCILVETSARFSACFWHRRTFTKLVCELMHVQLWPCTSSSSLVHWSCTCVEYRGKVSNTLKYYINNIQCTYIRTMLHTYVLHRKYVEQLIQVERETCVNIEYQRTSQGSKDIAGSKDVTGGQERQVITDQNATILSTASW